MDFVTDAKIQKTIQTQFADRTLLCIARTSFLILVHELLANNLPDRLRTIISYDRILVMDSGNIKVRLPVKTHEPRFLTSTTGIRQAHQPLQQPQQPVPQPLPGEQYHRGGHRAEPYFLIDYLHLAYIDFVASLTTLDLQYIHTYMMYTW